MGSGHGLKPESEKCPASRGRKSKAKQPSLVGPSLHLPSLGRWELLSPGFNPGLCWGFYNANCSQEETITEELQETNYAALVMEIKSRIRDAQYEALRAATFPA